MELSISNLPHPALFFSTNPCRRLRLNSKSFLPLRNFTTTSPKLQGLRYLATPALRSTTSEGTSTSANEPFEEVLDEKVIVEEETPDDAQNTYEEVSKVEVQKEEAPVGEEKIQPFEFMETLDMKVEPEDAYTVLVYGLSALISLWLASAVEGAIDSIPVFPKVLEIVGLAYTVWFTSRYLIFKKNRDELWAKVGELKQQVLGTTDK